MPLPGVDAPFAIGHEGIGEVVEVVPVMHMKGIHVSSALSNAHAHMPEVLNLLSCGRLHPELIVSDVIPFDSADQAIPEVGYKPVFVRPARIGTEEK